MVGQTKPQVSLLDSAFNRRKKRSRSDDFLKKIDQFVDWAKLEAICRVIYKPSRRGRPTIPIQFSLKCLILQYLYNLSDPALEDALTDRFSFQRFLGISFETDIPDFTTIWRFRERLSKAGLLDQVFDAVVEQLEQRNTILRRGAPLLTLPWFRLPAGRQSRTAPLPICSVTLLFINIIPDKYLPAGINTFPPIFVHSLIAS